MVDVYEVQDYDDEAVLAAPRLELLFRPFSSKDEDGEPLLEGDLGGGLQRHTVVFIVCGGLVVCTLISSAVLVGRHLNSRGPDEGIAVTVRILLMAPIYAVQAWIALARRIDNFGTVLEFLRKAYECVVLVAFLQFVVFALGGLDRALQTIEEHRCSHLPPLRWLLPATSWKPKKVFLRRTIASVLVYVPVTFVASVIIWIAFLVLGKQQEKDRPRPDYTPHLHATPYGVVQFLCSAMVNVVQIIAMYGLVLLCRAVKPSLPNHRLVLKLLSIKTLVFFTVWQAIICHGAARLGALDEFARRSKSGWKAMQIAEGILNALLCLEMLVLALVHHCIYPVGELAGTAEYHHQSEEAVAAGGYVAVSPQPTCYARARRLVLVFDWRDMIRFYIDLRKATKADPLRESEAEGSLASSPLS